MILVAACELEEVVIPTGDEILIVHAIMRPDHQRQFVLVEGSWRGEVDPADLDNFELPPNRPQIPIEGATVTVTNLDFLNDPCGSPVTFPEVNRGLYQGPANCPTMRRGDRLTLRIDTPSGDSVIGMTEVPGLDSASVLSAGDSARLGVGDSLAFNRDTDTLRVSVHGEQGRVVEVQATTINFFGDLSSSVFDRATILADAPEVVIPGSLVDLLERGEGDPVFRAGRNYLMTVGMTDQNYYDFVRSQNNELTGRGFINHLVGAVGVFGSLVASEVDVTVHGNFDDEREGHYRLAGQVQGVAVDAVFSMYVHTSRDSTGISTFINGAWVTLGEGAEGGEEWQPWDPEGSSHDGIYVGSALDITLEQPFVPPLRETFLLSGSWAPDSFQVALQQEAIFGTLTVGTLWAVKQ